MSAVSATEGPYYSLTYPPVSQPVVLCKIGFNFAVVIARENIRESVCRGREELELSKSTTD